MTAAHTIRRARSGASQQAAIALLVAQTPHDQRCDFEFDTPADTQAFDADCAAALNPVTRYLALAGRTVIGTALALRAPWTRTPAPGWLQIRVAPDWRGQGVGTRLLQRAEHDLRTTGVQTFYTEARSDDQYAANWLVQHGYASQFQSHMLDLAIDDAQIDIAQQRDRMMRQGVRLTTLLDEIWRAPASTLPRLYQLHTVLTHDVPLPDQPFLSYAHFARQASELPAAYFIAVDDDEQYIGESFVQIGGEPGLLVQRTTGVVSAHRGRGVATALKTMTIDYARRDDYARIRAWIESTNKPMLEISRRMGFAVRPGLTIYRRDATRRRPRAARPSAQ